MQKETIIQILKDQIEYSNQCDTWQVTITKDLAKEILEILETK